MTSTPEPDEVGHVDTIDPGDRIDPSEFEDYDEVDSTTVDSSVGAPD